MRVAIALLFPMLLLSASPQDDIRSVLERQAADWNRGDVRAFMSGYDQSDATTFIGKDITKGWSQVLARYEKAYPDRDHMGRLSFTDIEIRPLGAEYALVIGRFHLERTSDAGGDAAGVFSLIFHRGTDGAWKIIADHTS